MNFIDYNKEEVENTTNNSSDTEKSYNTVAIVSKTVATTITVKKDAVGTNISYNFSSLIPDFATITKKDITLYGQSGGAKKFITGTNNIIRLISAPIGYSDLELQVLIEYELSGSYYKISDRFNVDETRVVTLSLTKDGNEFASQDQYIAYLDKRILALESRVNELESK